MRLALPVLTVIAIASLPACAADETLPAADRLEQCRHFADEEPYDTARAAFIEDRLHALRCEDFTE